MRQLGDEYWSGRYREGSTRWDLGGPSGPLQAFLKGWSNKEVELLIPGCGNAYEAAWALSAGFTHITLLDISALLVQQLRERFAGQPVQIIHGDFFNHSGTYGLILEQTFFCALDPLLRSRYVQKMHSLLTPGGTLAGVLFNKEFEGGPPFGGSEEEYRHLFSPYFVIEKMEPCYNSIAPRAGTESFIILRKKEITGG